MHKLQTFLIALSVIRAEDKDEKDEKSPEIPRIVVDTVEANPTIPDQLNAVPVITKQQDTLTVDESQLHQLNQSKSHPIDESHQLDEAQLLNEPQLLNESNQLDEVQPTIPINNTNNKEAINNTNNKEAIKKESINNTVNE